ncbi:hypothetical protein C8Q77DRAFT_93665 [Trametes polyzona]|nr:hypothetical protein C8Q77DRAFT_93665 [Trametes polyzona]
MSSLQGWCGYVGGSDERGYPISTRSAPSRTPPGAVPSSQRSSSDGNARRRAVSFSRSTRKVRRTLGRCGTHPSSAVSARGLGLPRYRRIASPFMGTNLTMRKGRAASHARPMLNRGRIRFNVHVATSF